MENQGNNLKPQDLVSSKQPSMLKQFHCSNSPPKPSMPLLQAEQTLGMDGTGTAAILPVKRRGAYNNPGDGPFITERTPGSVDLTGPVSRSVSTGSSWKQYKTVRRYQRQSSWYLPGNDRYNAERRRVFFSFHVCIFSCVHPVNPRPFPH